MEEKYSPQNYLASVSDMMAGLLFIFMIVLMGFVYQAISAKASLDEKAKSLEVMVTDFEDMAGVNDYMKLELEALHVENEEMRNQLATQALELRDFHEQRDRTLDRLASENARVRSQMLTAIWQRLDNKELVTIDHDSGVLRLGEDYLSFSSGSTVTDSLDNLRGISEVLAEALVCRPEKEVVPEKKSFANRFIPEAGKTIGYLKRLVGSTPSAEAKIVKRRCLPYANKIEALFIEGHTDNVPLGKALMAKSGLKDNRELSTIRAVHTYNQMLQYAPDLATFKNEKGVPVISVSGYGADRPVKGHEWTSIKNDPVNRRIDIRIIMTPFIHADKNPVVES